MTRRIDLSADEVNLLRDMYYEAMEQYGKDAELVLVKSEERDLENNVRYVYDIENVIEMSILFDTEPQLTVRKYGFQIDKVDVESSVVYMIPKVDGKPIGLRRGSILRLKSKAEGSAEHSWFVGELLSSELEGVFYIATVTPYRQTVLVDLNKEEVVDEYNPVGSQFIKNKYKG